MQCILETTLNLSGLIWIQRIKPKWIPYCLSWSNICPITSIYKHEFLKYLEASTPSQHFLYTLKIFSIQDLILYLKGETCFLWDRHLLQHFFLTCAEYCFLDESPFFVISVTPRQPLKRSWGHAREWSMGIHGQFKHSFLKHQKPFAVDIASSTFPFTRIKLNVSPNYFFNNCMF